jgi:F-type H+-transporting ATPase subunit b
MFSAEFWVAVAFLILMGAFGYIGVHRRILGALDHRAERIRRELDEARRLKEEALSVIAESRARRESAAREADEIVANAREEAARIAAEAKTRLEEFVTRRTRMAENKIAQAEAQAMADVRAAAADAAVAAAGHILSGKVRGAAGDALVTQGIAEVRQKLN